MQRDTPVSTQRQTMLHGVVALDKPTAVDLRADSNIDLDADAAVAQADRAGLQPHRLFVVAVQIVYEADEGVQRGRVHRLSMFLAASGRETLPSWTARWCATRGRRASWACSPRTSGTR